MDTAAIDWEAFGARLIKRYTAREVAPSTLVKVRQLHREIGELVATTADLSPEVIDDWVIRSRATRAPITVNMLLGYLRKICKLAVSWKCLDASPFDGDSFRIKDKGRGARKRRHLSRVELATLLHYLEAHHLDDWQSGRLYALTMLYCHTGLRAKEALRLKVEDLDFEAETVEVVPRHRLKTSMSAATIPIPPAAIPCLKAWKARCGSEWLFPGTRREGPWVHGSNSRRPADFLDAAARRAGLPPGTTLLMLRHSLATHARTSFDLSPKQVQQILRHGDVETQEHYIAIDLDNLKAAVKPIDFRIVG